MKENLSELVIQLEELSGLTGLTVEAIQGDGTDERFRFYLLPKFMRPYRRFIYGGLAILIPLLIVIQPAVLVMVILLLILAIVIAIVMAMTEVFDQRAKQTTYQIKTLKGFNTKQEIALKKMILFAQEHNILVREFQILSRSVDVKHSAHETANREIAQTLLLLCRERIVKFLQLERSLREGMVDSSRRAVMGMLPAIIGDLHVGEDGIRNSSSGAITYAAAQMIREIQGKRAELREKLADNEFEPSLEQRIKNARNSQFGRVINQSVQNLLNAQWEISTLLSDR